MFFYSAALIPKLRRYAATAAVSQGISNFTHFQKFQNTMNFNKMYNKELLPFSSATGIWSPESFLPCTIVVNRSKLDGLNIPN